MFESPMAELLLVKPVHFVSLPRDPFPNTGRFGTGNVDGLTDAGALAAAVLLADKSANPARFCDRARARRVVI
jgi:hypothetical protein